MGAIWAVLLGVSVLFAAWNGRLAALTPAAVDAARSAVTFALGLAGVMALWLGLMRVAEEAGLVRGLSRLARPLLMRLFPEVPPEHPAMGAMLLNLAANALGLGNAATPLGVKAMQALGELNPTPGTASDAQALFCAMNTAAVQLVPATVIGLRVAAGSRAPGEIIGPTLVASLAGVTAAIGASKLLARLYRRPPLAPADSPGDHGGER